MSGTQTKRDHHMIGRADDFSTAVCELVGIDEATAEQILSSYYEYHEARGDEEEDAMESSSSKVCFASLNREAGTLFTKKTN